MKAGGPSASRPLRGVLFDAGGTLVQVHVDRLAVALRARGAKPADLDVAFWKTLVLLDAQFGPHGGQWPDWWNSWLLALAGHSGVDPDVFAEAWQEADGELHLWDYPIPGAAECLAGLRDMGLRVGVVSNSDGRAAASLARAGLAELVEVIVDSGVVGVSKPDPAIFRFALEPLGLEPAETWYLGDTVAYDAAAADAAGLTSWVIDHRGLHTVDHPRRVATLAAFTDAASAAWSTGAPRATGT